MFSLESMRLTSIFFQAKRNTAALVMTFTKLISTSNSFLVQNMVFVSSFHRNLFISQTVYIIRVRLAFPVKYLNFQELSH